ncbi:dienelactone hydrolase [Megasphaera cerevisiae DSM 20462]|jgi:dihydroneopterin aldolase|uniref:7,8-dihydroneopterin aldolase n=1 Tax=Megasphaera cerevisiae DSM 20462 TaxID=1122219 RepID=A0A0J6WWL4_9FIRM|nr:dihydroneopterin aldolase [Megasphaera cerevisiae]KMO86217.1 dienelactone hydrolase [Megasphaera cerevisiae DSM 20462]MCI1750347.1 dihydroneopterin aldolase [Megasphaera cerevisiae]OKY53851.1 dihydroneopterin aldolase [Megasphaera cerevisiae]SKA03075.1 dihydroneopterin aldolase [Megasphaera cerevisiae DSM 20462]
MDKIVLKGMRFYGYHGCLPEETKNGQPFYIDAVLYLDLSNAGQSDLLSDTVDYSQVYGLIHEIVEQRIYRLIERLAAVIADQLMLQFPFSGVDITVHKPQAPVGGSCDDVYVFVERRKV